MGKNLPAIDFHVAVAKRDPALAERLVREGLTSPGPLPTPVDEALPASLASSETDVAPLKAVRAVPRTRSKDAERPDPPRRRRGLVPRSNGREAGRITVYVPPELALQLKKFCFDRDRTMSDVAGELLIGALEQALR